MTAKITHYTVCMHIFVYCIFIFVCKASVINQEACFEEFRYCRAEILKMQHVTPFECPACHKRQHSAHIDGNQGRSQTKCDGGASQLQFAWPITNLYAIRQYSRKKLFTLYF